MEDRIVLSQSAATLAAPAQVHALAARGAQDVSVPIQVSAITVSNVAKDASTGALNLSGTITGTILGQSFSTPFSGSVVGSKRAPRLALNVAPIDLSVLGLGIKTSAFALDASGGRGALGRALTNELKAALQGTTAPTPAQLNAVLADPQVLAALNKALAQTSPRVASFTAAQGTTPSALDLTLKNGRTTARGLTIRRLNPSGGPITVDLTGNASAGLLGQTLSGIMPAKRRVLTREVRGALQQITATPVPTRQQLMALPAPAATSTTGTAATSGGTASATTASTNVLTIDLKPLNLNLLGLQVKTSEIAVTVSAQQGSGMLLGNLLSTVANLINLQGVNNALNNVLGNVVTLANSASLSVSGVGTTGPLISPTSTTPVPVLTAHVAPVHLNLLGAVVDTSPIDLSITANPGQGQVLGNVIAALANLLNTPPANGKLDIPYLTGQIQALNSQLDALIPGIPAAPSPSHTPPPGATNILSLIVAPINLNLLGLVLKTDQIQVNADAQSGSGDLLGNLLTDLLNTLNGTPGNLAGLNQQVNDLLAKVIGVLNATSITLPTGAVSGLSQTLQTLSLPNLVNTSGTPASSPVLDLNIASTTDSAPPIDVDLLGVIVTTSDVHAQLVAQTGDGQILGNLVYNVSHLLDPGGALGLLTILQALSL